MASVRASTWLSGLNDTGQAVTAGRAHIKKIIAVNATAAAAFLQFFDAQVADVTLGTTEPRHVIQIAANSMVDVDWELAGDYYETRAVVFSTTTATGSTGSGATVYLQAWVN